MNITDEMVEAIVPLVRRHHCRDEACVAEREREARDVATKIATVAAPLIAAQAALAERVKIATEVRQHAERTARTLGSSRAASIAVAAIENEVADRINVLPREDEERKCSNCGHAKRWHLNGRCAGDLLCCACTDTP
jgi:hypothetical protein